MKKSEVDIIAEAIEVHLGESNGIVSGRPLGDWRSQTSKSWVDVKPTHSDGSRVRVPHKGKMVAGKVVRHDKGSGAESSFYVVDVGEYESVKVPAHKVEKLDESIIEEAIVKQFPKSPEEHRERLHNTKLFNTYHKALAHAKTLSDNDLAARVRRHEDERHEAWHDENPARQNPDGNIPNIEDAHFKLQAYAYEHRRRKGQPHPPFDSFTPEYVDSALKDRY